MLLLCQGNKLHIITPPPELLVLRGLLVINTNAGDTFSVFCFVLCLISLFFVCLIGRDETVVV